MTCLENQKLNRQRKNGNGQEKNIWTDVELTKAEEKTLIWLAGWEESTVDNLLSVMPGSGRSSPRSNRIFVKQNKPSAFEIEIHPSHKLLFILRHLHMQGKPSDSEISS